MQVGAIILYTYVFHMLAPPSEGTFDIEDGSLPMKSPLKDSSLEQLPLLTLEEAESTNLNALPERKVRQI